jgi:hypothetical protein
MKKVFFVYFLLLSAFVLMAYFVNVPLIPTDEQYYVNFARCFVGIKDNCVNNGVPFGLSFFLIPFVLIKDLSLQFSSMIFFNSMVASTVFFVSYWFFSKNLKREENESIFLSALVTLLPSFFLTGKTIMTEPLFIVFSGFLFLLVYSLKEKDLWWKYSLLGFVSFLLFLIRLNGIIFLVLSFIYVLFFVFPKSKKALFYFVVGVLPLFLLKMFIQRFVFEDMSSLYSSSLNSFFSVVFSFSWLKNFFGYVVYTSIASFFVVPFFVLDFFRKRKSSKKTLFFVVAFVLNVLLVSVLFENGDRFDHHFYGRYIDAFLLPLILLSLDFVYFEKKRKSANLFIVLGFFLFSFLFMYHPENFLGLNVYSIFPLMFFFEWFSSNGFYWGIVYISFFSLGFYLLRYRSKFFILSVLFFLSVSAYFSYFYSGSLSRNLEINLPFYLNNISNEKSNIYIKKSLFHEYLYAVYKFYLPNLVEFSNLDEISGVKDGFLLTEKAVDLNNAYLLNFENHQNIALYTFDFDLYSRLKEQKKVIFDDVLNEEVVSDISVVFDFSFQNIRILKFKVKNIGELPWITYFPSRHSKLQTHEVSLREYCFDGDEIVGEKRKRFDSVVFPGESQEFLFYTASPVCSKITYDVVQEGYKGFPPVLEIELK